MPRGPNGEKRAADAVGCAVKVAMIATGEVTDDAYQQPNRVRSGEAGAVARSKSLSPQKRKEIASAAARVRWDRKEAPMNEKQKLMHTLFDTPGRELLNIKFCRLDGATAVSEEDFCARVNQIMFEIDTGLTNASPRFDGDGEKTVDVGELEKRLTLA